MSHVLHDEGTKLINYFSDRVENGVKELNEAALVFGSTGRLGKTLGLVASLTQAVNTVTQSTLSMGNDLLLGSSVEQWNATKDLSLGVALGVAGGLALKPVLNAAPQLLRNVSSLWKKVPEKTIYYSKSVEEMAAELQAQIGKNSVPFKTVDKVGHIDLAGKAHYDSLTETKIPTPHVQTYDKHIGPNGKISISRKSEIIRSATKMDIRIARRLAKQQGMLVVNEKKLMNTIIDESNHNTYMRPDL